MESEISIPANPGGRPCSFTEEIADEICERIACGESLVKICRDERMPGYRTVMRWLQRDERFRQNYASARSDSADANAERIDDVAELTLEGKVDPQAARVAIDALKWSAGRKLPKKYSDRIVQEHTGPDGGAIQVADVSDPKANEQRIAELLAKAGGNVSSPVDKPVSTEPGRTD